MKFRLIIAGIMFAGCSLFQEVHIDHHIVSRNIYDFSTGFSIDYDQYWHFTDTSVVLNGMSYQVYSIQVVNPEVYALWTKSAMFELNLGSGQISAYNRKGKSNKGGYTTYTNLEYYGKRNKDIH
jgi:hypothetical protein